jgi:hypothetical protein
MIFSKFIHKVERAKNYFQLFGSGAENAKTNIKASDRSVAPPTDFARTCPFWTCRSCQGFPAVVYLNHRSR